MKNYRNIIECCNNTHQWAPRTGKQLCAGVSDLGDAGHVICMQRFQCVGLDVDGPTLVWEAVAPTSIEVWGNCCQNILKFNAEICAF